MATLETKVDANSPCNQNTNQPNCFHSHFPISSKYLIAAYSVDLHVSIALLPLRTSQPNIARGYSRLSFTFSLLHQSLLCYFTKSLLFCSMEPSEKVIVAPRKVEKAKSIRVYANGDLSKSGHVLSLNSRNARTFDGILDRVCIIDYVLR